MPPPGRTPHCWLTSMLRGVSPDFYDLPAGTGLLLDLGRTVTVTSVQIVKGHS